MTKHTPSGRTAVPPQHVQIDSLWAYEFPTSDYDARWCMGTTKHYIRDWFRKKKEGPNEFLLDKRGVQFAEMLSAAKRDLECKAKQIMDAVGVVAVEFVDPRKRQREDALVIARKARRVSIANAPRALIGASVHTPLRALKEEASTTPIGDQDILKNN